MQPLNEEQLVRIEIDLDELKENKLNESFLTMFGATIKILLDGMFGGRHVPAYIRGTRADVNAFARTLGQEKSYMNAQTYKNKSKLDLAVKNFESETGLRWPFK